LCRPVVIGLVYNYYRDYDPSLGRYIQSDPIGLQGGMNTYGYVGGNPVNYIDPYGLFASSIPGVAIRNPRAVATAAAACGIDPNAVAGWYGPQIAWWAAASGIFKTGDADAEREKSKSKGIPEKDIGPSGKPKIKNVDHSGKKKAKDAATQDGKGPPINHPSPTVGKPHYHPADASGNKIPGTHHNY